MWLSIDDCYECSINGEVRNKKTLRILKTWTAGTKRQYLYCRVGGAGSKKTGVHRIVGNLFLPQPTCNEVEIDHIDRNPTNNHASNLRWVSKKVNINNRNPETKPRSNNQSGHLNIIVVNECNSYIVNIKGKYCGYFKNLEDAIKTRDTLLNAV
jgi:hypothetical protein